MRERLCAGTACEVSGGAESVLNSDVPVGIGLFELRPLRIRTHRRLTPAQTLKLLQPQVLLIAQILQVD